MELWTANRLKVITHDQELLAQLVKADEPIVESWREDGLTILGTDIRTLLGRGSPLAARR